MQISIKIKLAPAAWTWFARCSCVRRYKTLFHQGLFGNIVEAWSSFLINNLTSRRIDFLDVSRLVLFADHFYILGYPK